jgi:DNA-binding SARP family transcriptional activator/tetratricopeptide (TPR) repeat protein
LVTFPTRKALALLSYLVVEGGVQPRERITALLWPESTADLGRAALRKTLAYLRQALDAHSPANQGQPYILADRDSLQFNPAAASLIDIWLLQAAAQATHRPALSALGRSPSAYLHKLLEPLEQAVALLRGDLLAGFSLSDAPDFDDWATMQREVLHRQALQVFDRLSQLQFEAGELANAIATTTRWVAYDPLEEGAYRRLMQLHVANGDRSAALQAYATCCGVLERELDIAPTHETTSLAQRIKLNNVPARPHDLAQSRDPVGMPAHQVYSAWPMVGRAFEHGQLVSAYHALRTGYPQVITLEGEPGIGKTRLAVEFLAWAGAHGATVLQSRALEGGYLPYQPIVEALRSLPDLADLAALSPVWLAELSRLMPELADLAPDLPTSRPASEAEVRMRLFEAIARAGQVLAEASVLVVFIDDLQWADVASREVLQYAARRWALTRLPVLLICTLRSEELATTPALSEWLATLRRDNAVTRLTVGALSRDDTRQIVQAASIGDSQSALPIELMTFSNHLFAETSGHPLFIVQTLRSLAERDLLRRDPQGTWYARLDQEIPHSVRDLIEQRLARLSQLAQTCCVAGALLGEGFCFADLCAVVGLGERAALPALEELLTRGLVRETAAHDIAGAPRYFFTHDRVREVAYAQLSEARRRVLHADALAALQASAGPTQLAWHALRAGLTVQAADYSFQAGEASFQLYAIGDAIHHFEQVRHLWQTSDREAGARRRANLVTLYRKLGRAYELQNQIEMARMVYEDMRVLAREYQDLVSECVALNCLATIQAQTMRDMESALSLLQTALALAESSENEAVLIESMWNLAQIHFYCGRVLIALPYAERALMLAQKLDHDELIARTQNLLAYLTGNPLRWAESAHYAVAAQQRYTQLGDRAMEADCWSLIARAQVGMGQPAAAVRAGQAAVRIADEIENSWGQVSARFSLAVALLEAGDHAAALSVAQRALEIGQANTFATILPVAYLVLGNIQRWLGALQAARQSHLEAERISNLTGSPFRHPIAVALCADYALEDVWEEAYSWACTALETRASSNDFDADLNVWYLVEALLRGDAIGQAYAEVQRFGEQVATLPRYRIPHFRALAVLAEWERDAQRAVRYLEEAHSLAATIGLPGEQASILLKLAALDAAQGDPL